MAAMSPDRVLDVFRIENRFIEACTLDRVADALLQQGFRRQAERLAVIAAERRETAPDRTSRGGG
jgi:hypothetical protein